MNQESTSYKGLAEELVQKCVKKGANEAEVLLETGRDLSVEVRNGEIETVEESSSRGIGFRVFLGGKMAFSHCNDFSELAMDAAINSAIEFARTTTPDENNVLPKDQGVTSVDGLYDLQIAQIPMDKKIGLAKLVEKLLMFGKKC